LEEHASLEQNNQDKGTSHLLLDRMKRVNMITGKGGVGRSTLAAVMARTAAEAGKKTLLAEFRDDTSTESALAKNFDLRQFSEEPALIEQNLYGMHLSPALGQMLFLNSFLKINALSQSILKNKGIQWFLEGAPAFREMGFFYHLLLQLRKKEFDCIVLDLPATGHLVGLAKLPRILLRLIPIGPIAERLREGQAYFYDTKQTAAWIVTLPQTLPVSEAIELKNALVAETIPVGGFILNRVPFNPFTDEEIGELDAVFGVGQAENDVSGAFERIRRFREAKEKLCAESESTQTELYLSQEVFQPIVELTTTHPVRSFQC
jgi:arsenite-transporting ATPase